MAHLNKLAIRGIRSFDDKQISIIEFFSPVTVIVGHNGSGKTTIIECLKYATTGDQPPNTRGGAFIHDPKMANEKEVKAQVKLRFHAANGKRMLAVRNLSVSQKKAGGLTMKTLESILALDTGSDSLGKRGVISTKCAELDTEIPNLLGVSKAVLENVIFCHQEDSYWPLSEPATLKKKFDDIFEATKYTKALDNIKAIRKEGMAELKTEKERLDSLQREKTHADKLKARLSELNASITEKEVDYESKVAEYNELAISNKKFYELGSKFRDIYQKIETLEDRKQRFKKEKAETEGSIQLIEGSVQELEDRVAGFEKHLQQQKSKSRQEHDRLEDLNSQLKQVRTNQSQLLTEIGQLRAEEKAQEARIAERETLIHDISIKQDIRGFDHSPLERDKVLEFLQRLGDLQHRQNTETENLQTEIRAKREEYDAQNLKLQTTLAAVKTRKDTLRAEIAKLQNSIAEAERTLDFSHSKPGELRMLEDSLKDQRARLVKAKENLREAHFDDKIDAAQAKTRQLEDLRDKLSTELRVLSLDADKRARLDIKRAELKRKGNESETILTSNNAKFRALIGSDAKAATMERDLDRAQIDKDRRLSELERDLGSANLTLQTAEASLSQSKRQLKSKQQELKTLQSKLKDVEASSISEAIAEATEELRIRREEAGSSAAAIGVWNKLLSVSKSKHACSACNRHMDDAEMKVFEKHAKEQIKKNSPENVAVAEEEMKEWEEELKRLQGLLPLEADRNKLRDGEIPALDQQIREVEETLPGLAKTAELAQETLGAVKSEIKDITFLKQGSASITRLKKECQAATEEIACLEEDLSATGSTKTADDIQEELDKISSDLRSKEREVKTIMQDRDRQAKNVQEQESGLHRAELKESNLRNEVQQRQHLEEKIGHQKKEVASSTSEMKEVDSNVAEAQIPIEQLEKDYRKIKSDLDARYSRSQELSQLINRDVDKLETENRAIEKYVRDKRGRRLQDCLQRSEAMEQEVAELTEDADGAQKLVNDLSGEIASGGSTMANIRENLRVRRLQAEIDATQAEIDTYDLNSAAQAKQNFEDRYAQLKKREDNLHGEFSSIGGELGSERTRLKELEKDMKDFKDIQKRYMNQLIKVKMSDMANTDLEKYAKALDNAIMKYHSLKMEEVNDIMHHLWNKTYQGTDIDGIKIKYDAEGGATKRSYNYRVVMTKDQVEMDMRGRCSAGQKMLASIIIRLALSDSFGQNCGILALDEPTNALDVENIDALASSLIEVINARKGHSNFQLIIITHDENFLTKLGQSEVMDHYWRVSRDARQKSVIERQRFR